MTNPTASQIIAPTKENVAFTDLALAQSEMKDAAFNATNPHFKSKYADLKSVRAAVMPSLTKYGFSVMGAPDVGPYGYVFRTVVRHKSGVVVHETNFPLNEEETIHQQGSRITYARRYTLAGLAGIASDEDDDANVAQKADDTKVDMKAVGVIIKKKMKAAKSEKDLLAIWDENQKQLAEIKKASPTGYTHLNEQFLKFLASLEEPRKEHGDSQLA